MTHVSAGSNLVSNGETPAAVSAETALPLRTTDFDAGLASLLHNALRGMPRTDILNGLCGHLARLLRLRLVVLVRRLDTGAAVIDATSAENGLWLELQRIPERWDGGVSSRGPAGEALRSGAAVHMRIGDEGFMLWRTAADAEHVREILAVPLAADGAPHVIELYFDGPIARGATTGTLTAGRLAHALETFLADLRTIEQHRLLSQALASAGNAALITDLEGTIVWSNRAFSALSGYAAEEVVGRNPNLLSSGHQGVRYYRDLWGTIRSGKIWNGETVDCGKDGKAYTIAQTVSPVSQDGRITHYLALQQDIGRQKKERTQLELATRLSPETGLLTPAAFESAVRAGLGAADHRTLALVVISLRGVQRALPALGTDAEGALTMSLGQRICEFIVAPDVAGALGPFEYALLLGGDTSEAALRARLRVLVDQLGEPVPYLGVLPELDVHFGSALFPAEGTTFHELWLKADRRLADEPYRRARRDATH